MKMFEEPIVEMKKFDVCDVLTASFAAPVGPGADNDPVPTTTEEEPIMIGLCLGTLPIV